jgi:hypothetical protein
LARAFEDKTEVFQALDENFVVNIDFGAQQRYCPRLLAGSCELSPPRFFQ